MADCIHPYGTAVDGDETSLDNISHGDLRGYYEDFVGADRLIVSVVGDIDAAAVIDALTEAFADWRPAAQPLPDIVPAEPESGPVLTSPSLAEPRRSCSARD